MAYLFILASAACSILIAHLLKYAETAQLRTLPVLTTNYGVAGAFALSYGWLQSPANTQLSFFTLLFCGLAGGLFIGNFFLYSKSVHANGVGVTVAAMRTSLLVPVLVSIMWYQELVSLPIVLGIFGVMGALLLLVPRKQKQPVAGISAAGLLLGIFLITGLADASLKIYEEQLRGQFNELFFMGLIFLSALMIGIVGCCKYHQSAPTKNELALGASIGLPNLYSSIFLLYALNGLNGAVAYGLVNTLNVAGGTLLGLWWWNDTISVRRWWGLALAAVSILLLV